MSAAAIVEADDESTTPTSAAAIVEANDEALAASLLRAMPLPPAAGLALGLCGLAAIVEETDGVAPVVVCALAGACALLLAIAARAALRGGRALRDELAAPRVAFAYGVYEMALVLALGRATAGAAPALYACAALQLGLLGAFLAACAAAGAAPEPYWAPPCVGSGATCIAGAAALGPRHGLVLASWALACAGALLLAPAATLRVARDDAVANDATAFILQAPFSMPGLAFGAMRRAGGAVFGGRADAALGHALFAASTVGLAVAVLAAWRRRRAIFDHFEPKWAALTFPFCLSALCALGYAKGGGLALRIYALALAAAAAALVVGVAAGDARLLVGALRERRRGNESGKGSPT